jgi:hypothetical protein
MILIGIDVWVNNFSVMKKVTEESGGLLAIDINL